MLTNTLYIKKILLILVVFFCLISLEFSQENSKSFQFSSIQVLTANNSEDIYRDIDVALQNIFTKLGLYSFSRQKNFYKKFKEIIQEKKIFIKNEQKLGLLVYIEEKIDLQFIQYQSLHDESEKQKYNLKKHKTVILTFSRNGNHARLISEKATQIKNTQSVFIFKKHSDLSIRDIKKISSEIIKINPKILLFIDQEGGWINRYVEFENTAGVEKYFLTTNNPDFKILDKKIRTIFPHKNGYFPSLEKIGKFYDTFSTASEKKYFLEKIAYIRLQTLKENGINTYGLVADLNRGNSVIDGNARSFSKHLDKYKLLVDAFILASEQTGVQLYLKHFPGHGTGYIDTHKGVLSLEGEEKYLQENLELFNHFLDNKHGLGGLMVGHMYVPESLKTFFDNTIKKADYLLTDDLGMKGYKLAHGKIKTNLFFTTDNIINNNNLIIIDSVNQAGIK